MQTSMQLFVEQSGKQDSRDVMQKVFKSKHNMPKLDDYAKKPPDGFWNNVEKVTWEDVSRIEGGINADMLESMARQVDSLDKAMLDRVLSYVKNGARLGVSMECQVSSTSSNAASVLEHGEEVTDALVDWLHQRFVIGPFDPDNIPFENCKISGLMCKMKPNGKARIIVNMSKGNPVSVNEGINKDDFPTAMSSTTAWIRIMWRCGKNCRFAKCDWASGKGCLRFIYLFLIRISGHYCSFLSSSRAWWVSMRPQYCVPYLYGYILLFYGV